ncbi:hypothetical protein K2173_003773 [Erythroxylum novogranatense]|uniref:Uncharacterized protein n=1 Tax=Erythroxylum novogranatense TaxID=1862640 RepID=A0AAV8SJE6_9ROSI|nr:hypothetical protein K2173_003773 [Erythroxylum novogranatense]
MYVKATQKSISLLKQCKSMSHVKQIQSHLTVSATLRDPFAASKLLSFCALSHSGDLLHAYNLFLHLHFRSTFIWNTMISAFSYRNQPVRAILLYKFMLHSNFSPNNYTFSFLLSSCASLSDSKLGSSFHGQVVKLGWEYYDFVLNGLVHLYANCGSLHLARQLFDASHIRDVVTWTALISGYVKVGNVLIARDLFDQMPERNVVSWSAMITAYVQIGLFSEALELFYNMQISGFTPNHASIVGALNACASLGALDQGRWIHAYVKKSKMEIDQTLGASLVDMYAKCGCIETASCVFEEMPDKDVYAFTCLISGMANHGKSSMALDLFYRMQNEGVTANEVTFICVLNACSRVGLVDEGLRIFESMSKLHNIEPQVQHYGCLVDLLGRAGKLEDAKKVVREMPMQPDGYVLGALLDACRVHGHVDLGKEMVDSIVTRSFDHDGVHVLLSNMYASAHKWDDVAKVRQGMEDKSLKKVPGCSLIEVDGIVHEFIAGDRSHVFTEEIMLSLGMDRHVHALCFEENDDDMTTGQIFS